MTGDVVRVLLVDDHAVVREGLAALLASVPGMAVVGGAATGRSAVREAVLTRPDVVVMDLQMPDGDGITATRDLVRAVPEAAVLVLTMYDDDAAVFAALRAGARGYLLKGGPQLDLARAVRSVADGEVLFGPGVAVRALQWLTAPPAALGPGGRDGLTHREREVLGLLADGAGPREVARHLGLSDKTVANHLSAVVAKLRVRDRDAAVAHARAAGWGTAGWRPPPVDAR